MKYHLINCSGMQGINLFHPVKPMLASRHSPEDVIKLMEGSSFIIEQKFDGERVQIHKNGKEVRLYSRLLLQSINASCFLLQDSSETLTMSRTFMEIN